MNALIRLVIGSAAGGLLVSAAFLGVVVGVLNHLNLLQKIFIVLDASTYRIAF